MTFRGAWNSATGYIVDDAVSHLGSAWLARASSLNTQPVEGNDWTLLASRGEAGPTGLTGPSGAPGPQGIPGIPGVQGPPGVAGLPGPAGADGAAGAQGPAGPAGPQGLVGPAGTVGATGPAGPQGGQGPQGPAGLQGPSGGVGPAGPPGPAGAAGPVGPQGIQGPVGSTGPIGPRGLLFRGEWNPSIHYAADDAISHLGSAWIARRASQNVIPTEGEDWSILARMGDVGPPGPAGAQGPRGIRFRGSWGLAVNYALDDAVQYNGSAWVALRSSTGIAPSEGEDWTVLASRGEPGVGDGSVGPIGPQGPKGVNFRGAWSSETSYGIDDALFFQGSAWLALQPSSNVPPSEGPIWAVLARKGDPGPAGPAGANGADGTLRSDRALNSSRALKALRSLLAVRSLRPGGAHCPSLPFRRQEHPCRAFNGQIVNVGLTSQP